MTTIHSAPLRVFYLSTTNVIKFLIASLILCFCGVISLFLERRTPNASRRLMRHTISSPTLFRIPVACTQLQLGHLVPLLMRFYTHPRGPSPAITLNYLCLKLFATCIFPSTRLRLPLSLNLPLPVPAYLILIIPIIPHCCQWNRRCSISIRTVSRTWMLTVHVKDICRYHVYFKACFFRCWRSIARLLSTR